MRAGGIITLAGAVILLASCSDSGFGSKGGDVYHPDYGPFDENGDYVESLADAPAKKRFFRRSKPKEERKEAKPEKERRLAKVEKPVAKPVTRTVVKQTQPARTTVVVASRTQARPEAKPREVAEAKPTPKPKPAVAPKPKPKPKPKAVVATPKKKAPLRHVVKKGDTLYSLSRRYGTTVSAIQRANGLSGATIMTGKTLLIPR